MSDKLIAQWQTKGGKHWYKLYKSIINDYHFVGENASGPATSSGGVQFNEADALAYMERLVASAKRCGQKSFTRSA